MLTADVFLKLLFTIVLGIVIANLVCGIIDRFLNGEVADDGPSSPGGDANA